MDERFGPAVAAVEARHLLTEVVELRPFGRRDAVCRRAPSLMNPPSRLMVWVRWALGHSPARALGHSPRPP